MIAITSAQLEHGIGVILWPFVRIGSCFMVAPVFGAVTVPAQIRVVLSGAIALLVAPLVPLPAGIALLSGAAVLITIQQVVIGVALGFSLRLVFEALSLGGQMIANSMGLSLSFNIDPLNGTSTPALGQLYTILVTLIFLLLDGHTALIRVLAEGFRTLPIGVSGFGPRGLWTIVNWGSILFSGALAVALPGITALLITNLAFGIVSRAAPTLNLFATGLPISILFGLLVIIVTLPVVESGFIRLLGESFMLLRRLSGG
ncbi:MAG: flagellar biosynthetic protein FliR [Pseudomonadota bacterium]|jgi:flagellar biosynthetic protein FliR|nr:flagellar biosynthetic protein FliR [Pseudomonadota bacterium]